MSAKYILGIGCAMAAVASARKAPWEPLCNGPKHTVTEDKNQWERPVYTHSHEMRPAVRGPPQWIAPSWRTDFVIGALPQPADVQSYPHAIHHRSYHQPSYNQVAFQSTLEEVEPNVFEGDDKAPSSMEEEAGMAQSCEAHPACNLHVGLCCPTEKGAMMQCCNTVLSHWEKDAKYIITLNDGAVVRKDQRSTSEEVTKYEFGTVFDVLEHAHDQNGDEKLKTKDGWINAACHETREHVADHLLPTAPGELYMVTAPKGLVVRRELEKTSDKVASLLRGDLFRVLERAINSEGIIRLRTVQGWVSETCSKGGDRVSEPVAPKTVEHFTVLADQIELYVDPEQTSKVDPPIVYKKGDMIDIIERFITTGGKLHLRTSKGWFAKTSEAGEVVAIRTRGGRPVKDAPPAEDAPPVKDAPPVAEQAEAEARAHPEA